MDEGKAARPQPTWWSRPRGTSAPRPVGGVQAAGPVPRPLHGEDPYGTPPYGGPGPWAPAPPVQRPVPTPARGTRLPAQAQPPAPESAAAPSGPFARYDPWAPPSHPSAVPPPPPAPDAPLSQDLPDLPARPAPRPASPAGPRRVRRRTAAALVALALAVGGVGGWVGSHLERTVGFGTVELSQAPVEDTERDPGSVAGIAERALPGVVTIHVRGSGEQGTGTGFVLDKRGHLLTNHHVVEPAEGGGDIRVTFHGGETAAAEIVGTDSGYDLAVLRVEGVHGLRPLPLGNSDSVRVGDPVVAIGAPYDLAGTVTEGIISAKERPITAGGHRGGTGSSDISYVDALQTDAPINPGNSGGPLMDARGRVIGINSAIRAADNGLPGSGRGGSIGLGFAIPVNQAKRVAEELINTGRATHPVIGVTLDMEYTGEGARVALVPGGEGASVVPGGPADRAGIEEGDVITEVDGTPVRGGEELIVRIRSHRPGDRLELTVERGGRERTVEVVLGSATGS